jgi:Dolichyl-phosphate-mannose-protein mannosyltransferase
MIYNVIRKLGGSKALHDLIWPVVLWGLFAGILVSLFLYSYNREFDPDEFEHMHTAWKLTQGQKIYVDFFQHHPPFFDYMITPVIRTFGETVESIFVARYVMLLLMVGILTVTYFLCVRIFKNSETGIISLILTSTIVTFYMKSIEIRPDVPQALAGLLSIYLLFVYYDKKSLKSLIASAVFLAVSYLFLQKSIGLIIAIGGLLFYDLYKRRVQYKHVAIYAAVFCISVLPYYVYLSVSGSFGQYFVTNWLVNYYLVQSFSRLDSYIALSRENTITGVLYLMGIITMFRTDREKRFAVLSILLMILPIILFHNLFKQYLILAIPPFAIVASYALNTIFTSRLIRFVFLIGAIYLPMTIMHNYGLFKMNNKHQKVQLAKIEYVLSITDQGDKVYDGEVAFNVFRDDIDYFWFCLDIPSCLDAYKKVAAYQYDIYKSIAVQNPKVISSYHIHSYDDIRIRYKYRISDKYPDLYIRTD